MRLQIYILLSFSIISTSIWAEEITGNEALHLKTDRDIYISGESLFFQLWYLNQADDDNVKSNYAYLIIRDAFNQSAGALRMKFSMDHFSGSIYLPDTLKTGYYEIVTFTNYMRNFGEGHYCRKEILIVNRFDENLGSLVFTDSDTNIVSFSPVPDEISIAMEKDKYFCREKVTMKISLNEEMAEPLRSNLSVSPVESFLAGIHNSPPQSKYYREEPSHDQYYLPENEGVYYYGIVKDSLQRGLKSVRVFVSVPDSLANLFYVTTDEKGEFSVLLNEYYLGKEVFFILREDVGETIQIYDKFSLGDNYIPSQFLLSDRQREYIDLARNIVKVQKAFPPVLNYSPAKPGSPYIPTIYSSEPATVYPSDYLFIENLLELSREILPSVKTRRKGDNYTINLRNDYTQVMFEDAPLIIFNGVPINEIDPLIPLDSDDIYKIEYMAHERFIGDLEFSGTLAVFTNDPIAVDSFLHGSYSKQNIPNNHPSMESFNGKEYLKADDLSISVPDFRQTLYWNSEFSFDNDGTTESSFYCPDIEGEFMVSFMVLSKDGRVFTVHKKIHIDS